MKKQIQFLAVMALMTAFFFSSCGPGKKLMSSQARVSRLQKDSTDNVSKLKSCNAIVTEMNIDKASLKNQNDSVFNDLSTLSAESKLTIADQAKRLKNLQTIIQSQKDVMTKLKTSITDALMNYKADELSVYIKDGNVYVSLEEKLLFQSGSDVVDPKGKGKNKK